MTIPQLVQAALQHHREGRLAQAESLYRQILDYDPKHAGALHLLGLLRHQSGRSEEAVGYIRRAIAIYPSSSEFHSNLGIALVALDRTSEAMEAFQKAVELNPQSAEAHNNLAIAQMGADQYDLALISARRAVELKPQYAEAHNNLGNAYKGKRNFADAAASYRKAIELQPKLADAWQNLSLVLAEQGEFEEAIAAARKAVEIKPNNPEYLQRIGMWLFYLKKYPEAVTAFRQVVALAPEHAAAWNNLASALTANDQTDEGIEACRKAIAIDSNFAAAWNNLGIILQKTDRIGEEIEAYERAIELDPLPAKAHTNLATALQRVGRFDEALAHARRAVELDPENAAAHTNLARVLFITGQLREAWVEDEWRKKDREYGNWTKLKETAWDGSDLNGRTILLHTEQGLGDSIQYIRYAKLVAQRGGKVIVACQPALIKLFTQSLSPQIQVVSAEKPLPKFDVVHALRSLPIIFDTTVENVPAEVPYLKADPGLVEKWRAKLAAHGLEARATKVGIAWAGNPKHTNDRHRSTTLETFAPLALVENVRLTSLQVGPRAADLAHAPEGMNIIDLSAELTDFTETAALLECLDLVIAVDTSVVHLAGALGRPVWTLLHFANDWRWLIGRSDTPWYPTMKLYRQAAWGDWREVMRRVAADLSNKPRH